MDLKKFEKTIYPNIYKNIQYGTYAVDISLGIDKVTGKRLRTTRTGLTTLREARLMLNDEDDKKKQKTRLINNFYFEDLLEEYYSWCILSDKISKETLIQKRSRFDNHIVPFFTGIKIDNIDESVILEWHQYIKNKKFRGNYLSASTNNTIHKQLSAYFNWLVERRKILDFNPCKNVENFKIPKKPIRYRTLKEMNIFWDTVDNNKSIKDEVRLRISALTKTLFFTGLRPGEFYGLKFKDFDYDLINNNEVNVDNVALSINRNLYYGKGGWVVKKGKTEDSIGTIFIGKNALQPLFNYVKYMQSIGYAFTSNDYILINGETNKVFSQEHFRKYVNIFIKKSGLPHTQIKDMRSSHGTLLLSKGFSLEEVQSRLRHTQKTTTEKYYATFYDSTKIQLAKDIDNLA